MAPPRVSPGGAACGITGAVENPKQIAKQESLWDLEPSEAPGTPPGKEGDSSSLALTKRQQGRLEAAERAITERNDAKQDVAYTSRVFALTNLPNRRIDDKIYERRNGRYFLRLATEIDTDLPYGQDRLLVLLLATEAKRQKSRQLNLGTARDILSKLNKSDDGYYYKWLAEGLNRLFTVSVSWGTRGEVQGGGKLIEKAKMSILEQYKLWYTEDEASFGSRGYENHVYLTESWYEDIMVHGWPVEMPVALSLADRPFAYDLYVMISCRAYRIEKGETIHIPLGGPNGLINQTGTVVQSQRKFRQMVKIALESIKVYWPQCPAYLSEDGDSLAIASGTAVLPQPAVKTRDFHGVDGTPAKLPSPSKKRASKKKSEF